MVTESRLADVVTFYERLTDRSAYPGVRRFLAVVTRIHGDATERLMREVFDEIGVDDLLAVLRTTPRGGALVYGDHRQRGRGHQQPRALAVPEPATPPAPTPADPPVPVAPADPPVPVPVVPPTDVPAPLRVRSEWFDGTEDWPVLPPKLDPDGFIEGVIYTPGTRPPFDPTSKQRWDRRYWEREAAKRAESGDLTLWAKLIFWDMLPPGDRVLPDPSASESRPVS